MIFVIMNIYIAKAVVYFCQVWWHTPLIPALRRQSQVNLWAFEASLVYRVSSRPVNATL